jgi:hypothetical protein
MKTETLPRIVALLLLLLNGIPALITGSYMIADPTGSSLNMNISLLEFSPFKTFFIPGIILFTMNGLLSIVTLIAFFRKVRQYPLLIFCQGLILTIWIAVQTVMIMESSWLQIMYGFSGLALMAAGLSLENILYVKLLPRDILKRTGAETHARS